MCPRFQVFDMPRVNITKCDLHGNMKMRREEKTLIENKQLSCRLSGNWILSALQHFVFLLSYMERRMRNIQFVISRRSKEKRFITRLASKGQMLYLFSVMNNDIEYLFQKKQHALNVEVIQVWIKSFFLCRLQNFTKRKMKS